MTQDPASFAGAVPTPAPSPAKIDPPKGGSVVATAVDPPTGGLILASASPRRQQLLSQAGYKFEVHPSEIDEKFVGQDLPPSDLARTLARAKAWAVLERFPDAVILAADTIVCFGERILGKPTDERDARRMLSLLSGTTQVVITGLAVVRRNPEISNIERVMSSVRMKYLTRIEFDRYIASGLWQGKAGGYGIQDPDPFVIRMSGCRTNIVGLPMTATRLLLASAGVHPIEPPAKPAP